MRILGIDPGTARIGWAVIEERSGTVTPVAYGCITTEKTDDQPTRLKILHDEMLTLLDTYDPACLSVEDLFFAKNATTAISVGQARGVVLLTAALRGKPVVSYSPVTVKQTITGSGKADKKQVERMVMATLKLKIAPTLDDTVDALAIAMTHAYSYRINKL